MALIVAPVATWLLKGSNPEQTKDLGVAINAAATLLVYAGAWWVAGANQEALQSYAMAAISCALGSSGAVGVVRNIRGRLREDGER